MKQKIHNSLNHRGQSGFTILEVLIAIAVLSIGLLSISMMQAHFTSGNSQSRQMIRATDIAMNQMEVLANLTNLGDARLNVGNHTSTVGDYERNYTLSWNVVDNGDRTLSINIAVSWQDGNLVRTLNFPWLKSI